MIRPSTDAFRERPGRTALVVGTLAVAMVLPALGVFSASTADRLLRQWLADYRPVVYLTEGTSGDGAEQLAGRVEEWPEVDECTVRTPEEAYGSAADRVGEEALGEVGVRSEMFPHSLTVEPAGGVASVELVSRLEALETGERVETVDVPSAEVTEWRSAMGTVRVAAIGLFVLSLFFGLAYVGTYLRELRAREYDALRIWERLGAPPEQLRRASLVRGAILGVWAGLVATTILLAIALYWRTMEANLLGGIPAAAPRTWLVVAAPVVIGPVGGVCAGLWAARRSPGEGSRHISRLEPLLEHD
jgi:cell division protein FtsX